MALDRQTVRDRALQKFGVGRMVDGYVAAYRRILDNRGASHAR